MSFQVSPGVLTREFDLTGIIPTVSTTEGGMAGGFRWGPLNELVYINSEAELLDTFWQPNNEVASDWFTAANFLAYGNKLFIARVADENNSDTALRATNATASNSDGFLVKNDTDYEANYDSGILHTSHGTGPWIAKHPGDIGNSIRVSTCASDEAFQSTLTGTVTITETSKDVVGDATLFTTETIVGDLLVVNNEIHKIKTITDDTNIILETPQITAATASSAVRRWEYWTETDLQPDTTLYTEGRGGENDELHVVVVDEDGEWTNTKGTILEVHQNLSLALDAKADNGESTYYKDVINRKSKFLRWAAHDANNTNAGNVAKNTTFGDSSLPQNFSLQGGSDGTTIGNDEKLRGYTLFDSGENVDVSLILGSDANQTVATYIINNVVEKRKDCIACISPAKNTCVDNYGSEALDVVIWRNALPSTSYAFIDSGWKMQYDKYNDVYRWVPLNGDIAGLAVRTDTNRDPWWSFAGLNRGHIKNVYKLAWNPQHADRDYIYKAGVNPVITKAGQGTILYGDKTMLKKPSSFDRVNVRRLFIVLEKSISTAAEYLLFEFNDVYTRENFKAMIEPYLRTVKGRRGITDYEIKCDEHNNPPDIIDRNEFVASIFIKPARSINFITLNFVATRTGVEFSEIVGRQF